MASAPSTQSLTITDFAPPLHHHAEGPTDPSIVTLPPNFTVAIAGGSRGIGLGIAKAYARASASGIVLASRSLSSLEDAATSVVKINPRVKVLCQECDVTSSESVRELAEATKTAFGRVDVLIVNAGLATRVGVTRASGLRDWPVNFHEQPVGEMEDLWRINVHAPFMLAQAFLPLLEATRDGAQAVIQLSSAAANYTSAAVMAASYSLTKMAGTRLIELLDEAHSSEGVVAHAIQPGGVKTDMAMSVPEGKGWEDRLIDDVELAGAMCVWLTKEKRTWLSGRYIDSRWDVDELVRKKDAIVEKDLLKFRMRVE